MTLERRTTAALGASQLLAWASSYYLLAILAVPMAAEFGIAKVAVYAMFSAALVVAAALGPVMGRAVDKRGGRRMLMLSNGVFASAQLLMATAQHPAQLALGWLLLGAAMPMGLYDAAFATLVRLFGTAARPRIVGVTLIAGFASSVSWPLTAFVEHHAGWRWACALWALLHLTVGLFIHARLLPRDDADAPSPASGGGLGWGRSPSKLEQSKPPTPPSQPPPASGGRSEAGPSRSVLWLLATVFAASGFTFAAFAAHLPRVLEAAGASTAAAVFAASLVGASQVVARVLEVGVFSRWHPLYSARISLALHPLGVLLLGLFGAPAAVLFTVLHGAGVGLMTIVKGTLPLALFGPQGFGERSGWLEAPSRVMQASAPILFGLAVDGWGVHAIWLTGVAMFLSFLAVLWLRRSQASAR
ncbi:MAG: MFS transporter [Stagnimonas sp.]|nr:MFS transporter [Stagnimonas sp.]